MILPSLFHNSDSFKTVLLSNQGSLLEFLSMDKSSADSQSVSPNVRFPEYDSRMTAVRECRSSTPKQPDNCEGYQGVTQSHPPQQCSDWASRHPDNVPQLRHPTVRPQETNHIKQNNAVASLSMEPAAMRETLKAQTKWVSFQHRSLAVRAERAERRLHALLGEHAVSHCTNQLQSLGLKLQQEDSSLRSFILTSDPCCSSETKLFDVPVEQKGFRSAPDRPSGQNSSQSVRLTKDMQSLVQCGQEVLQEVQKALDSDATASSSDEEWEDKETQAPRAASG